VIPNHFDAERSNPSVNRSTGLATTTGAATPFEGPEACFWDHVPRVAPRNLPAPLALSLHPSQPGWFLPRWPLRAGLKKKGRWRGCSSSLRSSDMRMRVSRETRRCNLQPSIVPRRRCHVLDERNRGRKNKENPTIRQQRHQSERIKGVVISPFPPRLFINGWAPFPLSSHRLATIRPFHGRETQLVLEGIRTDASSERGATKDLPPAETRAGEREAKASFSHT
jgi:hypothetical protein